MYRLGLDIGITSVGWAVLETNPNGEPYRIIDLGSRIFDAAENPKTGESLAKPRRDARGARRRNRRHVHRNQRIRGRIVSYGLLTKDDLIHLFEGKELESIYKIRCEALDRKLTKEEFARLLIHLAQKRGFKSNRKNEGTADQESGKLLSAIAANTHLMTEKGYRTVGEMLYKDESYADCKRNKAENYRNMVSRSQMIEEIKMIFESQRSFDNSFASETFEADYLNIFTGQRSFDEGPATGPYSGNQIEKMIGKCTFEKGETRAAKATYTFERFNLIQKINHLRIVDENSQSRLLTEEEREKIIVLAHETAGINYTKLRKTLELPDTERFNLDYGYKDFQEVEKKTKFEYLKYYHHLRKCLDKVEKGLIDSFSVELRDAIGEILIRYKTDDNIRNQLKCLQNPIMNDTVIEAVLEMPSVRQVGNLSVKAMRNILPFLEEGMNYDMAACAAGYDFRNQSGYVKSLTLPPLPNDLKEISSPVVKRAVSQTIKVINAIVKRYGSPMAVNIELAREMSKNRMDRDKIKKEQEDQFKKNEKSREHLKQEFHLHNPNGQDLLKYKLWEEQDGICLYSGKRIEIGRLFEQGYVEIDHIVPYSFNWDNRYTNKVLVFASENQEKKNRVPLAYLEGQKRDDFIVRVKRSVKNYTKLNNLLTPEIDYSRCDEFRERNLTDTKFITSFMRTYIDRYLIFDDRYSKRKKVTAVNGAVTANLRTRWGLRKVREDGDLHHSMDAVVIGCVTDGLIQRVTKYWQRFESEYGHVYDAAGKKEYLPLPWPGFREEVQARLSEHPAEQLQLLGLSNYDEVDLNTIKPVFVSRYKKKKKTGAAHEETVKGIHVIDGRQYATKKVALTALKLDDKTGKIKNYYRPEDDRLLYEALKLRLLTFNGDAKKAFAEPFYKPAPKGGKSPEVKRIKMIEPISDGVLVNGGTGIANNERMVCVDIYQTEERGKKVYYGVPVYVKDMVKSKRPNRGCICGKPMESWKVMHPDDFIFSLCKNDVVHIRFLSPKNGKCQHKDSSLPEKMDFMEIIGYFDGFDIANAQIHVITHDNTYRLKGIGLKTLPLVEKFSVDLLGNIQPVGREKL